MSSKQKILRYILNTKPISPIQFLERPPMKGDQPQSECINNINTLINMRFWALKASPKLRLSENHNFHKNGKPKNGKRDL